MKLKKVFSSIVLIVLIAFLVVPNVFAATATNSIWLGRFEIREGSRTAYSIGNPNNNNTHIIWNLVKWDSKTSNTYKEMNIYCVNPGVGMGSNGDIDSSADNKYEYDTYYDMKKDKDAVLNLSSITETEIELSDGTKISSYDALLALGDMLYLPGVSSEKEKTDLLNIIKNHAATDSVNVMPKYLDFLDAYPLTDDEINVTQQAVIWYFTNYGETTYDNLDKSWLNYKTETMSSYADLTSYNLTSEEGKVRDAQIRVLYKYLIEMAEANAKNYSTEKVVPVRVNTATLNYIESEGDYIVGPINITESENNTIPYTIDFSVKKGSSEEEYKLLDSEKNDVTETKDVEDLVGQDFYVSVSKSNIENLEIDINVKYNETTLNLWTLNGDISGTQPVLIPDRTLQSEPVKLTMQKPLDLALRKYITKITSNGNIRVLGDSATTTRIPDIDEATLSSGTTARYKHRKDPVSIETGDVVTYNITIYNEGQKVGRATQIIDQLPTGLKFSRVVSGNFEANSSYNESGDNKLVLSRKASNTENLASYTSGQLSSETIEIECVVTAVASEEQKVLTNVAWISEEIDGVTGTVITNQEGLDRDSEPATKPTVNKDNMADYKGNGNKDNLEDSTYYYKGQQDDDDFEKLVLEPQVFDLKLIKNITELNGEPVTERLESIDVNKLNISSNSETTAVYNMNKNPISVSKGDIVTYRLRVYNEGTLDGYASEITEDIPEGLEFLWSEKEGEELEADSTLTQSEKEAITFNQQYLWGNFVYNQGKDKVIQISSDYLSRNNETIPGDESNLIKAFGKNDGTKTASDLSFKEIFVKMKVVSDNVTGTTIRNEACISEDSDKDGNTITDRDSDPKNWVKYEDDEDYDNIILKPFDLSLRKFIIAVSSDENIEESEYLKNSDGSYKRAPVVDTTNLNTIDKDGKKITTATYNHTKEPILVQKNDIVIYMLRVYNEGEIDGYAAEIKDHLPSYLEFIDGEYNKQYGWTISEDGRTATTTYLENQKIKAADIVEKSIQNDNNEGDASSSEGVINTEYMLSYKEVPIMCRVRDSAKTNENITNIADITKYLDEDKKIVTDRDSQEDNVNLPDDRDLPGYKGGEKGDYIPGQQDDDDFEKVIVKEFDLALRKWVTQAIVIENEGQTVTETGHQPYDDPEQVVKVELHRKKLNQVTVKFRYSIRIVNEGDIAGYAKEITDYVPTGLKFVAEDNPGWTDEGNNIISTRLLENTLLQPGEYADIEVLLTWINNEDNMGVMTNTAEISKDYNEYGVPDRDSVPDNQKWGEDDIDDAPVMLSISTGQMRIYFTLGFVVLITIAGGVVLIKKYVL